MTCRCASNTLRSFIRSIAQVDIARSRQVPLFRHEIGRARGRYGRHQTFERLQRRPSSTLSFSPAAAPSSQHLDSQTNRHIVLPDSVDLESAFADISPESIDALAAELTATNEFENISSDGDMPPNSRDSEHRVSAPRSSKESCPTPSNTAFRSTWSPDVNAQRTPQSTNMGNSKSSKSSNIKITRTSFMHSAPLDAIDTAQNSTSKSNTSVKRPQFSSTEPKSTTSGVSMRTSQEQGSCVDISETQEPDDGWIPPPKEPWMVHKAAMKERFPEGWKPQKRLSPDAMEGIRALHQQMPEKYTSSVLADHFKVSPEAIRRILKSKWRPDADTQAEREARWFRRGERVWTRYAELGVKPPRKWRDEGIGRGKPEWKKKEISQAMPKLVTTARRNDNYIGNGVDGIPGSEKPQLVTTAKPPEGYEN